MATDNLPYEGERTKANDKRIQPYTQGESSHNKTNGDLNKMDETSKKESLLTKWMKEDRRLTPSLEGLNVAIKRTKIAISAVLNLL